MVSQPPQFGNRMISLIAAETTDFNYLRQFDLAPSDAALSVGIRSGCLKIVSDNDVRVGFLLYSVLWGTLPFLEFIEICPSERRKNVGGRAVRAWEQQMADQGFDLVLISTGANADAQHFWRKMGYVDCGALTVRQKPAEVFFQRAV